ncbi:MAG: DUF1987 domain-containing protein [Bacteroidales bacterium]|nr:DUF1987 domain-containing protein [Bacteroidales bacterium]
MDPLIISGTEDTPEVILNKKEGTFQINGRSLPEDVIEFYTPVFSWLEQYVANPNEETKFKVKIDYFNSASQRAINEIFNILTRINLKGKKIIVEWYFYQDDDEMREAGQEYAEITNLNFQYISYVPD